MYTGAYSNRFKQLQRQHIEALKENQKTNHGDLTTTSKKLHVETAKRRRAMAIKRKTEIDKEERRRQEILAKRREEIRLATERFQRLNRNYVPKTEKEIRDMVNYNVHERATSPASLDEVLRLVNGRTRTPSPSLRKVQQKKLQRSQSLENTYQAAGSAYVAAEQVEYVPNDAVVLQQFTSPAGYHFMQVKNSRVPSATPVVNYGQPYKEKKTAEKPFTYEDSTKKSINSKTVFEKQMEQTDNNQHALGSLQSYVSTPSSNVVHMEKPAPPNFDSRPSTNDSKHSVYADSLEVKASAHVAENLVPESTKEVESSVASAPVVKLHYSTVPAMNNRPPSRGNSPNVAIVQPQPNLGNALLAVRGHAYTPEKSREFHQTEAEETDKSETLYDSLDEASQDMVDVNKNNSAMMNQNAVVNFVTSQTDGNYPRPVDPNVTTYMNHGSQRKAWITPSESDINRFAVTIPSSNPYPTYGSVPYSKTRPSPADQMYSQGIPSQTSTVYDVNLHPKATERVYGTVTTQSNFLNTTGGYYESKQAPVSQVQNATYRANDPHSATTTITTQSVVAPSAAMATYNGGMSAVLTGSAAPSMTNQNEYNVQAYTTNAMDPIKQLETMSPASMVNAYMKSAQDHNQGVVYGGYGYSQLKDSSKSGAVPVQLHQPVASAAATAVIPTVNIQSKIPKASQQEHTPAVQVPTMEAPSHIPQPSSAAKGSVRNEPSRIPRPKNPRDYTSTIDDLEQEAESFRPPTPVHDEVSSNQAEMLYDTQSEPCITKQEIPPGTRIIKGILKKKPSSAQIQRNDSFGVQTVPYTGMKRSMSASGFGTRDSVEVARSHFQQAKAQEDMHSSKKTVRFSGVEYSDGRPSNPMDFPQRANHVSTEETMMASKPPLPKSAAKHIQLNGHTVEDDMQPHPPTQPPSGRAIMNNSNIVRQQLAQARINLHQPANHQPANQFVSRQKEANGASANDYRNSSAKPQRMAPDRIPLDRTPTDDEINLLWEKVQGYLHQQNGAAPLRSESAPNIPASNGASHVDAAHSAATVKTKYIDGASLMQPSPHYPRASSATTHSAASRPGVQPRVSSAGGPFGVRKMNMETLAHQNKRTSLLNQRRSRASPNFGNNGMHPSAYDGYPVQMSVRPLGQPKYETTSHLPSNGSHGHHNEMSESLAAFVAAENMVQQNQGISQSQLETAIRDGHMQQFTTRQQEPSSLSIEEKRLMQSLERLDERLKVVTSSNYKGAVPTTTMPRPPPNNYQGFRGKAIHIPGNQAFKRFANGTSSTRIPMQGAPNYMGRGSGHLR